MKELNRYFAEVIGTFALVFIGCGAIIVNDLYNNSLSHLGVSAAFGLVVLSMIYSVGNISGAHFNPAVTIGFFVSKRLKGKYVLPYIISQLLGGIIGAYLLNIIFAHKTLGSTLPSGSISQSFVMEVVLTFILMFVILNVSTGHKEKGIMAGVAIGGTVFFSALFGGPISGASMNPARSLAPALVSGQLQHIWIYILAPIAGAILASPTCRIIQQENCCIDEK